MIVKVLEIIGKDAYLIKGGFLPHHIEIFINGEAISSDMKKDNIVFYKESKLEYMPQSSELKGYERGSEFMSVEDYIAKPQYYDEDCSDEQVLRAIANKKELEGFKPVYKDKVRLECELNVYGNVADTGSNFITCGLTNLYSDKPTVYLLDVNRVTVNEYNKVASECSDHAKFDKPGKYLRFTKINNSYTFSDGYPFNEIHNEKVYLSLQQAQEEEAKIRTAVSTLALKKIFPNNLADEKRQTLIAQLKMILKSRTKPQMDELLKIVIDDLKDYKKQIQP